MQFDIVIPFHEKDLETVLACVDSCKYVTNKRNIFLVSENKVNILNTTWIDEKIFPFTKKQLLEYNNTIPETRIGWYYQQLIKLYSFIIPEILNTYMVLDSDVVFKKQINIIENNTINYNVSDEYTQEYFDNMKCLNTYFERSVNKSGICHFMVFQKHIISEIFNLIKEENKEIYQTIIEKVQNWHHGFSEYELYFHYIFKKYPKKYNIKQYKYLDVSSLDCVVHEQDINYIACHSWKR